jgi:hypothetical protein
VVQWQTSWFNSFCLQECFDDLSSSMYVQHPNIPGRRLMPPPHRQLKSFVAWLQRWSQAWDSRTQSHIFTLDTMKLCQRIIVAICQWRLSGR